MRYQYRHPKVYDFLIRFLYSKKLMSEFSAEVGRDHSVFDIAAGYGRAARHIHRSNSYYGIDLNEHFVRHGRNAGLAIDVKNILEEDSYHSRDVFLAIDIIHHFPEPKLKDLFDLIFKHAEKKVVIIEPAFTNLAARYGIWAKPIDWFFRKIDYDGFNKIDRWFTNEEYRLLFENRFSSQHGEHFQVNHRLVSNHHLATFTRI